MYIVSFYTPYHAKAAALDVLADSDCISMRCFFLMVILSDWDIPRNKVVSIVHDNVANVVKCTDQLNEKPL